MIMHRFGTILHILLLLIACSSVEKSVFNNDEKKLTKFLKKNPEFNINSRDENGKTLLHKALDTSTPSRTIISILLSHNADVNASDNDKMTPLHYAVKHRDSYLVDLLIRKGANSFAKNKQGKTPFEMAGQYMHNTIIKETDKRKERLLQPMKITHYKDYLKDNKKCNDIALFERSVQELLSIKREYYEFQYREAIDYLIGLLKQRIDKLKGLSSLDRKWFYLELIRPERIEESYSLAIQIDMLKKTKVTEYNYRNRRIIQKRINNKIAQLQAHITILKYLRWESSRYRRYIKNEQNNRIKEKKYSTRYARINRLVQLNLDQYKAEYLSERRCEYIIKWLKKVSSGEPDSLLKKIINGKVHSISKVLNERKIKRQDNYLKRLVGRLRTERDYTRALKKLDWLYKSNKIDTTFKSRISRMSHELEGKKRQIRYQKEQIERHRKLSRERNAWQIIQRNNLFRNRRYQLNRIHDCNQFIYKLNRFYWTQRNIDVRKIIQNKLNLLKKLKKLLIQLKNNTITNRYGNYSTNRQCTSFCMRDDYICNIYAIYNRNSCSSNNSRCLNKCRGGYRYRRYRYR